MNKNASTSTTNSSLWLAQRFSATEIEKKKAPSGATENSPALQCRESRKK
jgi:hypothetical protein